MEELLKELNISKPLSDLFKGQVPVLSKSDMFKYYKFEKKEDSFPHPPFIIPIFVSYDADHYHIGLVKHWFVDRALVFGDMADGGGFTTTEIARTEKQFFHEFLFNRFVMNDCVINDDLKRSAELFNIAPTVFNIYEEINKKTSFNCCAHPDFETKRPLNCIKTAGEYYDGDFPSNSYVIIAQNLEKACYYEIHHKEWIGYEPKKQSFSLFSKKNKHEPLSHIPEWLKPQNDKKELFEKYMYQKEYGKAWLTLNSPGFNPKETGERLQQLKENSDEAAFHLWADYWCEKYGESTSFLFI